MKKIGFKIIFVAALTIMIFIAGNFYIKYKIFETLSQNSSCGINMKNLKPALQQASLSVESIKVAPNCFSKTDLKKDLLFSNIIIYLEELPWSLSSMKLSFSGLIEGNQFLGTINLSKDIQKISIKAPSIKTETLKPFTKLDFLSGSLKLDFNTSRNSKQFFYDTVLNLESRDLKINGSGFKNFGIKAFDIKPFKLEIVEKQEKKLDIKSFLGDKNSSFYLTGQGSLLLQQQNLIKSVLDLGVHLKASPGVRSQLGPLEILIKKFFEEKSLTYKVSIKGPLDKIKITPDFKKPNKSLAKIVREKSLPQVKNITQKIQKKKEKFQVKINEKNKKKKTNKVKKEHNKTIHKEKGTYHVNKNFLHSTLDSLDKELRLIKAKIVSNKDKTISFVITDLKERSVFKNLGIKKGDQIIEINSQKIKNFSVVMNLFSQIKDLKNLSLKVKRKDFSIQTLNYKTY